MEALLGLLLLSLLSFTTLSSAAGRCNPDDYRVLMQIRHSIDSNDHFHSWIPNTDCCNWPLLECDPDTNRINKLTLVKDPLPFRIPPVIGNLTYLTSLILQKVPNLTGSIPRSISQLKHLDTLWLSWTSLAGPVPDFLNQLRNLTYLNLSFNQLSGSIPPNLSQLTKLNAIFLDRNRLTGTIPDSFGRFKGSVPDLYLSHNQLTGAIPESFGNMDFRTIDLSRNMLVGDASILFKPNGTTLEINLSRNMFEFNLSKVGFAKSLIRLDLNHNRIYGGVPKELAELGNWQLFNVSYNRLCGEIPTGGNFERFDSSSYLHNRCLCGPPLLKCK